MFYIAIFAGTLLLSKMLIYGFFGIDIASIAGGNMLL